MDTTNHPPADNASPNPALVDAAYIDAGSVELSADFEAAHAQVPLVPPSGGDFHAAFPLPDGSGKVAVIMGDVAGHGPKAAAQAQQISNAIVGCLAEGLPPSEALGFVNAAAEMNPNLSGFTTVFAATVEPETGHIAYASGGHEPALIATPETNQPEGNRICELPSTGPPLGAFGAEEVHYTQEEATLAPGATLLLYTDGVTETRRGRVLLGVNRLRRWTACFAALPPARLVQKLVGKVHAFAGNKALRDDLALLILRRRIASKQNR